ncbi:FIG00469922: hypothetical protein [hydrothermal vent metagenome]|uniref:Uncharacterized protein n=1 Tax=hydrothermal vent metagenome TaxID=652676 RepID=A0A1W1D1S2_9ZZZZ
MLQRSAFSMIELIFVIVIMGILGKFGVEFFAQSYSSFIFSKVNNTLQAQSQQAVEFVANRLQYRIKDSIIGRNPSDDSYVALSQANENDTIIEWIQTDIEGFRGITKPYWSGIIDLDNADANASCLISPETNTSAEDDLIDKLSYGDKGFNDAAIYFVGGDNDIDGYGWDGNAITTQDKMMHPIKLGDEIYQLIPRKGGTTDTNSFSGVDVYEYYKLAWSANAVAIQDNNLTFYYDYQPWDGEKYTDGKSVVIMENVSTFRAIALGSVVKIQVCVKSKLVEEYAICKEKTIF